MPLVKIELIRGHSSEYKKDFLGAVRGAIESALGVPSKSLNLRLYEIDKENIDVTDEKSEKFCIVEISMFPRRSREMKGNVIKSISGQLSEKLGVPKSDMTILIIDPPLENWGVGGVQREG